MAKFIFGKALISRWEKAMVELLLLRKHDFETVLKATIMKEWAFVRSGLSQFPYFDDWAEVDIQDVCIQSKVQNYPTGKTVLGDGFGYPNMVYFILEGKAILVQHLVLVRKTDDYFTMPHKSRWGPPVRCMPPGTPMDYPGGEVVFIKVAEYDKGECFSLGENMVDRRVLSMGASQMMLIPIYTLLSRNVGHMWTRMRDFMNRRLPPQKEIFQELLNGRDWMAYRKDIVATVASKRNNTTIHDVPLYYRATGDVPAMRYSAYTLERAEDPRKWRWLLRRKQNARREVKIAAAKLEFHFDEEFKRKMEEEAAKDEKTKKKGATT